MLAFVYVPVLQKELDIFRTTIWNHKRGRKQENKMLPTGVPPDVLFEDAADYGGVDYGVEISDHCLLKVAEDTSILDKNDNFISQELADLFEPFVPDDVEPKDAARTFISLKEHISQL